MLGQISNVIKCEVCGNSIELDTTATIKDYSKVLTNNINDLSDKVDSIIGKYLVYRCVACKTEYKYTYKDIERALRKKLTEEMLLFSVHGEIQSDMSLLFDKFLIYCGKCNGFDGLGACPMTLYNKCEIKRFPTYEL